MQVAPQPQTLRVAGHGGVKIAADVIGSGPLVLFVHGFPELRQSWHQQMAAVAAAGFTACAMDTRGNGESDAPPAVADYAMANVVDDVVAVADALSPDAPVTLVGHDWGASTVWHSALARPDRFGAVAALSVPWLGVPQRSFDVVFTERFTAKNRFFYQAYFQEVGRAEAELDADPARFLRTFYHVISGLAAPGDWPNRKPADARLLEGMPEISEPPPFLDPAYFDHAVASFTRTGFRGGLNRYRNHARDFAWVQQFDGIIRQPALFIGGLSDPAFILGAAEPLALMRAHVPNLDEALMLEGCGHWTQSERGEIVTTRLLAWLQSNKGA